MDTVVTYAAVLDVREGTVLFLARSCGFAAASWTSRRLRAMGRNSHRQAQ